MALILQLSTYKESVASAQQNSSSLKFLKFRCGSYVISSCHQNSSRSEFPYVCGSTTFLFLPFFSIIQAAHAHTHTHTHTYIYIHQRHQYGLFNLRLKQELVSINFPRRVDSWRSCKGLMLRTVWIITRFHLQPSMLGARYQYS